MALREIGFHDEGKELFLCFHLEHRGIVIAKMIVCALPEIGMGSGGDFNPVGTDA